MEALIKSLAAQLETDFNGKTVGAGGDFGALLTRGPFPVYTYFHQWEDVHYPSINVQIVSESFTGQPLECCGGGVMDLLVDFRISVDSKKHGWSIASALHEAFREWLCEVSGTTDLIDSELDLDTTPMAYTYVATIEIPTTYHIYEGEVFSMHVMTRIHYVRQEKGEFAP
jgi:hypothetical protein